MCQYEWQYQAWERVTWPFSPNPSTYLGKKKKKKSCWEWRNDRRLLVHDAIDEPEISKWMKSDILKCFTSYTFTKLLQNLGKVYQVVHQLIDTSLNLEANWNKVKQCNSYWWSCYRNEIFVYKKIKKQYRIESIMGGQEGVRSDRLKL